MCSAQPKLLRVDHINSHTACGWHLDRYQNPGASCLRRTRQLIGQQHKVYMRRQMRLWSIHQRECQPGYWSSLKIYSHRSVFVLWLPPPTSYSSILHHPVHDYLKSLCICILGLQCSCWILCCFDGQERTRADLQFSRFHPTLDSTTATLERCFVHDQATLCFRCTLHSQCGCIFYLHCDTIHRGNGPSVT